MLFITDLPSIGLVEPDVLGMFARFVKFLGHIEGNICIKKFDHNLSRPFKFNYETRLKYKETVDPRYRTKRHDTAIQVYKEDFVKIYIFIDIFFVYRGLIKGCKLKKFLNT